MRLTIGTDQYITLEQIPDSIWYQVTGQERCQHITTVGDMVRNTTRGWEFFLSLDANSPRYVLPNRSAVLDTHTGDEEE